MQFPKQCLRSRLVSNSALGLMTIALPLVLSHNAAQANDIYYQDNHHPESYRWNEHRRSAPSSIFQIPLQQHSTQSRSTTIFQNGQVIRIYEDQNTSGNYGGNQSVFYPQRRSVEFSIGNQGEFRTIERFPISPWKQQPGWDRPIEASSFRYGFPSRHHRRW